MEIFNKSPYSKKITKGISLFTAVKNRADNLELALESWLKFPEIDEIIIIDWDSDSPLNELINKYQDGRIFLFKVENQPKWMPSHPRNLGARLTTKNKILKMDADALLLDGFFDKHKLRPNLFYHSNWRIAKNENETHLCGNFFSYREDFFKVNGFNEYIKAYGWEDSDLYIRMEEIGLVKLDFDQSTMYHIPHEQRHIHQADTINTNESALSYFKIIVHKKLTENGYGWGLKEEMTNYDIRVIDNNYAKAAQKEEKDIHSVRKEDYEKMAIETLRGFLLHETKGVIAEEKGLEKLSLVQLEKLFRYWNGELIRSKKPDTDLYYDLVLIANTPTDWPHLSMMLDGIHENSKNKYIKDIYVFCKKGRGKRSRLKYFLERNNINLVETNGYYIYKKLFAYINDLGLNKKIIISEPTLLFNSSISLLKKKDLRHLCIFINAWDYINGAAALPKLGTAGDFQRKSAVIFETPLEINLEKNIFQNDIDFFHSLFSYIFTHTSYRAYDLTEKIKSFRRHNPLKKEHSKVFEPFVGITRNNIADLDKYDDTQVFIKKTSLIIEISSKTNIHILESILKISENHNRNLLVYNPQKLKKVEVYIKSLNTNINVLRDFSLWAGSVTYDKDLDFKDFLVKHEESDIYIRPEDIEAIAKQPSPVKIKKKRSYKISVITPSYNAEEYIENAIESVLLQGYKNFEHIIVDGGSTDGTLNILKKYPHLIWISEADEGQSHAMNKGFEMSSGDIITYLNADDFYLPDAFNAVVAYFKKGAKFVIGRVKVIFEDGTIWPSNPANCHYRWLTHWNEQSFPVNPVGYFYRREIQEHIGGYNQKNHLTMDLEFLLAASQLFCVKKINKELGVFRLFKGTKTIDGDYQEGLWSVETFDYVTNYINKLPPRLASSCISERDLFYEQKNQTAMAISNVSSTEDLASLPIGEINNKIRTSIKHIFGKTEPIEENDKVIVIAVLKNENYYVKDFLSHYLFLGVHKIILLETGNNYKELCSILDAFVGKVSAFHSDLPWHIYKDAFYNYLLNKFGRNKWTILVEIDEFFDFPLSDMISLEKFVEYLELEGFTGVVTHKFDMLPPNDESPATDPSNNEIELSYPFFNPEYIDKVALRISPLRNNSISNQRIRFLKNGIYKNMFNMDDNLTKVGLVYYSEKIRLSPEPSIAKAKLADVTTFVKKYRLHRYYSTMKSKELFRYYDTPNLNMDLQNALNNNQKIDFLKKQSVHKDDLNAYLLSSPFLTLSISYLSFAKQKVTDNLSLAKANFLNIIKIQSLENLQLKLEVEFLRRQWAEFGEKMESRIALPPKQDAPSPKVETNPEPVTTETTTTTTTDMDAPPEQDNAATDAETNPEPVTTETTTTDMGAPPEQDNAATDAETNPEPVTTETTTTDMSAPPEQDNAATDAETNPEPVTTETTTTDMGAPPEQDNAATDAETNPEPVTTETTTKTEIDMDTPPKIGSIPSETKTGSKPLTTGPVIKLETAITSLPEQNNLPLGSEANVSYIIGYRESTADRKSALVFVLRWLRSFFPNMEILIVEQDEEPKLVLDESLNVKQLFVYNKGLYNRCWAFNVAVKHTNKNVFIFSDSDVVLKKEHYLECLDAINIFDAVTPNKETAINIAVTNPDRLEFHVLEGRILDTFASMFMIMTRNGYERIGGWDERFEGWGAEDNALSHIIFNKLTSKTFKLPVFHIDHPRSILDGNRQPKYEQNWKLSVEIETLNGKALDRYVHKLSTSGLGNPKKYEPLEKQNGIPEKLKFVFAVTTYNRVRYLKDCIGSFLKTRSEENISWHIVIADDGSTDETKQYLEELSNEHDVHCIFNNRSDIAHQTNTILKYLSGRDFDLCFKSDDDVHFLKEGWDLLYWNTIKRTGYEHLIYYDEHWNPAWSLDHYITKGDLINRCEPNKLQGAFYTITKNIIEEVGYIDEQRFKTRGYEHVDFSLRCCRADFNVLTSPFDVNGSNEYIRLQSRQTYLRSLPGVYEMFVNTPKILKYKKEILTANRAFVPYNENYENIEAIVNNALNASMAIETPAPAAAPTPAPAPTTTIQSPETPAHVPVPEPITPRITPTPIRIKYKRADSAFYSNRGMFGVIGFILKRIYNISIDLKLFFITRSFKKLGKTFCKIGMDLINIDQ